MKKSIAALFAAGILSLASAASYAKERVPKTSAVHTCKKNDSAKNALACNMVLEAAGEGRFGMLAVGFVTFNRMMEKTNFPNTLQGVIHQKNQFSWTIGKGCLIRDNRSWSSAHEISDILIFLHQFPYIYKKLDLTKGATYYHTKTVKPRWARSFKKTVVIGNHIFYKSMR